MVKALKAPAPVPGLSEDELDKRIAAVTAEAKEDLALLRTFEVKTADELEVAAAQRAKLKAELDAIEKERKSFTDPLNELVKRINAKVKPATTFLDTAIKLIGAAMGAFQQREEERQRVALEAVQEMAVAGDVAGATLALARVESQAPKILGTSMSDLWYVVSIDADKLDRSLMTPDMTKISELVRASKSTSPAPGIVAAVRKVVTQRGVK